MKKILLLGGTGDAVALARQLAAVPGIEVTYSLAGLTAAPNLPDCRVRRGGFGGAQAMAAYLRDGGYGGLLDASHPYARTIAEHGARAAAAAGLPMVKYLRPPWAPGPGDHWTEVADAAAAAAGLAGLAERVFLSIGSRDLAAFQVCEKVWFLVRLITPPAAPPPLRHYDLLQARGPFTLAGERTLLAEHRIGALVAKNSGGDAVAAKLAAARELALPVLMLARPSPPDVPCSHSPAAALSALQTALA